MATHHSVESTEILVISQIPSQSIPIIAHSIPNGCNPFVVKRANMSFAILYKETDRFYEFSRAMKKYFGVPMSAQKYIGRGTSLIDMSSDATRSKSLQCLGGKTLLLLGKSRLNVPKVDFSPEIHHYMRHTRSQKLAEAHNQLTANLNGGLAKNIYDSGLPKTLIDRTDVRTHARFNGKVSGLGQHWVKIFRATLGTGIFPHLRCSHVSETSRQYGCVECIEKYFTNWYALVHRFTEDEIKIARGMASKAPGPDADDFIDELCEEMELLDAQFAGGIELGKPSPLSDMIADWASGIVRTIDAELNHTDKILKDIESIYTALEILEGGLGPAEYDGMSSSHIIVDVRLFDDNGNLVSCF